MHHHFSYLFFYSHPDVAKKGYSPKEFSAKQVETLMKRTLGDIICDNTEINEVAENVFLQDSPRAPCPKKSTLSMAKWDYVKKW